MNTLENLKIANRERCPLFGSSIEDWNLPQWGNAVAGETGEMCNIIKKIDRGDFTLEEKRQDLADEVADQIIYLDMLCQKAGIDMEQAIISKFNKTSIKIKTAILLPGFK